MNTETSEKAGMKNGLKNLSDIELRRELWMWRALGILLLLATTFTNVTTYVADSRQHAQENRERTAHWLTIETLIKDNADKLDTMNGHISKCMNCHSDAAVTLFNQGSRKNPTTTTTKK